MGLSLTASETDRHYVLPDATHCEGMPSCMSYIVKKMFNQASGYNFHWEKKNTRIRKTS